MAKEQFAGDRKEGRSLLHSPEEWLKAVLVPCVPRGIETYHLTLTTIVWSILVVIFSWLATYNRQWMWGASLMVAAQYITDLLDGAIGRERNTGLIKWGFYMDHFLDYIFLCAMLIGYSILMPNDLKVIMFFIMAVFGAFMANSFLQFAATNQFRISYWGVGPTEIRIVFILINTLIIYVNRVILVQALPYVLGAAVFGLFFTAYNTQRELWQIDMTSKAASEGGEPPPHDEKGLVIRHFLLSFILASIAFWILIAKIGGPFSRWLAGAVYVSSWVPLVLAFQHKNWVHFKEKNPRVKRFGPLAIAGLVLAVCTWAGVNLMPMDQDIDFLLGPEGEGRVERDCRAILKAQTRIQEIQSLPMTESALLDWLKIQSQWRDLMQNYQAYGRIDFHEEPGLHTDAFLIGYAAMALHRAAVLKMVEQCSPGQLKFLNQPHPELGLSGRSFTRWKKDLIKPDTLLKFGFNASYTRLLVDQIHITEAPDTTSRREALETIALQNTDAYYELLKELPEAL